MTIGNVGVNMSRPKGYVDDGADAAAAAAAAPPPPPPPPGADGVVSVSVPTGTSATLSGEAVETMNTLMITNLPAGIEEEMAIELVKPFGEVKAFNLIANPNGTTSTAVLVYAEDDVVGVALEGLRQIPLGDQMLDVQRIPDAMAEALLTRVEAEEVKEGEAGAEGGGGGSGAPDSSAQQDQHQHQQPPTCVLKLGNMVQNDDLFDDESYDDLVEDVTEELVTYGALHRVLVPRPASRDPCDVVGGQGFIFVRFKVRIGFRPYVAPLHGRRRDPRICLSLPVAALLQRASHNACSTPALTPTHLFPTITRRT
jgi:splicing factor U2AF subunit